MKQQTLPLRAIRVPAKRIRTLETAKRDALAADILEHGLTTPILVRADGDGYVLVEGLHRLEAAKALGEETIEGILVQARRR